MNAHLLWACLCHLRARACSKRAEQAQHEAERNAALDEAASAMLQVDEALAAFQREEG